MDPLHLRYMHTTHLLTPISFFQTPTLSLSQARTLSLPAKTQKTENSNLHGFEVHRPSSKGTKLLLQVIKAIINQSPPALPVPSLMIHSVRCVTAPLTRQKCFSVTYVGIWTASSPLSLPSLLGYGNVPCVPLLPPYPAVHCDTSTSPLPSLTLL